MRRSAALAAHRASSPPLHATFVPLTPGASLRRVAPRDALRCSAGAPKRSRARVRRADSCRAPGWPWRGRATSPGEALLRWARPRALRRLISAMWRGGASAVDDSALPARVARLGAGVVAALMHALQRSLGAEPPVVEYGITEPHPDDKIFVDPLRDWDPSPVNYYHDSFGTRVYLSASSPTGLAIALEFREELLMTDATDDHADSIRSEIEAQVRKPSDPPPVDDVP